MRGEFEPGQKLTLRKLAASLGTSMTPVREAVSRLSAYGALQVIPKRHILVKPLTAEKYMEIVDTRKLLEGHATARASENITDRDIRQMRQINDKILAFAKEGNQTKSMIENQRFHFAIYHCAGSETLTEAIECQWLKVGPSIAKYLGKQTIQNDDASEKNYADNDRLIVALESHDALSALKIITNIIDTSATHLFDALRHKASQSSSTLNEIWA